MEENINREIRNYREQVFMGLSLRQCLCCGAAVIASVVVYLGCYGWLGTQITSWVCILVAVPLVILGFFTWHGMSAEKVVLIWLRDALTPRYLAWHGINRYALYLRHRVTGRDYRQQSTEGEENAENDETNSKLP